MPQLYARPGVASTELCGIERQRIPLRANCRALDKETVMKLTIVEIGSVARLTKDYSGNFFWDAFVYDFKKYAPWG
jgi:hypothetical protein